MHVLHYMGWAWQKRKKKYKTTYLLLFSKGLIGLSHMQPRRQKHMPRGLTIAKTSINIPLTLQLQSKVSEILLGHEHKHIMHASFRATRRAILVQCDEDMRHILEVKLAYYLQKNGITYT